MAKTIFKKILFIHKNACICVKWQKNVQRCVSESESEKDSSSEGIVGLSSASSAVFGHGGNGFVFRFTFGSASLWPMKICTKFCICSGNGGGLSAFADSLVSLPKEVPTFLSTSHTLMSMNSPWLCSWKPLKLSQPTCTLCLKIKYFIAKII